MSMTFSTCLVYNIWCLVTFNFMDSKAIANCQSAIFVQFRGGEFLCFFIYWSIQSKVWWYGLVEYDLLYVFGV